MANNRAKILAALKRKGVTVKSLFLLYKIITGKHQTYKHIRHLRILSVLNRNTICVSSYWQEILTSMTKSLKFTNCHKSN